MKKRLNIIFFSLCFLGSVIAETYFIQEGADNLFSVIALGIVVLITGYLCMDSIRSKLSDSSNEIRHYLDRMYQEESQRFNERFSELQNLQKATYTATKKNTAILSEQMEDLLDRIEALEGNNTKALQKLVELQKKALEGQKNALGLEINYNKENTKQLMKAIGEAGNQSETLELMNKLLEQLEQSTQVIHNQLQNMNVTVQASSGDNQHDMSNWNRNPEVKVENLTETGWDVEAEVELDSKLSDWDSNSEPVIEEIDNSWDVSAEQSLNTAWDTDLIQEESIPEWNGADETATADDNSWGNIEDELNHLIGGLNIENLNDNTPGIIPSMEEESIAEVIDVADETMNEDSQEQQPEIKPLYEDPNKALSADEIAALFASFGQ